MKGQTKYSCLKERISDSFLSTQKSWAIWIGSYANRLSRKSKEAILALFIIVSVSWSLLLIIHKPQPVLNTGSITKPVPMDNNKGSSSSLYLDSISSAESSHPKDSLHQRN